jgi:hypothetical protein
VSDVALHLPAGVTVVDLPEAVQITQSFASYEQRFSIEGDTVRVHRRLRIPHDRFLQKAAELFRTFFLETDAAAERPILLRRETRQ